VRISTQITYNKALCPISENRLDATLPHYTIRKIKTMLTSCSIKASIMELSLSLDQDPVSPHYRYNTALPNLPSSPIRVAREARPVPTSPTHMEGLPTEIVAHIISYVEPQLALRISHASPALAHTVATASCQHGINTAWGNLPPPIEQWSQDGSTRARYGRRLAAEAHWDTSIAIRPRLLHTQMGPYGVHTQTPDGQWVFFDNELDRTFSIFNFGDTSEQPVARNMPAAQSTDLFGAGELLRAQFSTDGTSLVLATTTGHIVYYHRDTEFMQAGLARPMHENDVQSAAFSADLSRIATVAHQPEGATLHLTTQEALRSRSPALRHRLPFMPIGTQITADGKSALVQDISALWLYSFDKQKPAQCLFSSPTEDIISVHLQGNAVSLVTATGPQALLRRGDLTSGLQHSGVRTLMDYGQNYLHSSTFDAHGHYLVCQSQGQYQPPALHLFDLKKDTPGRTLDGFGNSHNYQVAFSPDESTVMLAPVLNRFDKIQSQHGILFHSLNRPEEAGWMLRLSRRVTHTLFRQTPKHIMTCGKNGDLVLWRVNNPYERS
jgi:WD40 repeat protein